MSRESAQRAGKSRYEERSWGLGAMGNLVNNPYSILTSYELASSSKD